ncbi:MAG: hydroxyacid dehydrogenase [Candidatus Staskawiczbacteria bacterium]|nr:hydroxyacid dehydrogenase [Candidatus Staskawiczbacteria bacterium]
MDSNKLKIAFFEIEDWEKEYMRSHFTGFELKFFEGNLEREILPLVEDCQVISIFTSSQLSKEVLRDLPSLKMISVRATGFDNIDIEEAKKNGILVFNVPTYGENTVAEHTFGLILNLSRKIHKSIQSVKENGFIPDGLRGFDLKGKTLGIVGTGHIGSHVARIARGFEMNVVAFDAKKDKKLAKNLGFEYVSLEDLLKNSDIITLHLPYNKNTHHLINSSNIVLIKKGSYLVNTARGGLVETSALVGALEDGTLAGAGLDVLEEECYIKDERELLTKGFPQKCDVKTMLQNHVLMERENVIVTPHNAFNSKEALERILETTVENIQSFSKNKPINTVK